MSSLCCISSLLPFPQFAPTSEQPPAEEDGCGYARGTEVEAALVAVAKQF